MRVLGIDYGTKRIGLAVSDETQTLARELDILSPKEFRDNIKKIISQQEITKIIVGLPLNLKGQETVKTQEVRKFKVKVEALVNLPMEFMDERLSTVMAKGSPSGKQRTDSLAAQIILQNYLNKRFFINKK